MNEDIENRLRRALRPVDPSAGFTERVMRALPAPTSRVALAPVTVLRSAPRTSRWQGFTAPAALAASLVVAVLLGQHVGQQQADRDLRAGLAARAAPEPVAETVGAFGARRIAAGGGDARSARRRAGWP